MHLPQHYTQSISRQYPALFIFLLDQSSSMEGPVEGYNCSKAEFATDALNALIYEMIESAGYDKGNLKKNAYLSILGYNSTVYSLLPTKDDIIDLPYLDDHPRGHAPVIKSIWNTSTNSIEQKQYNRPFWVTPRYAARTHMAEAFLRAKEIAHRWIASPPEANQAERKYSFPPIIINITDGEYNDGDPVSISEEIQKEGTLQGNILIFNCHFSGQINKACIFPKDIQQVKDLHWMASDMFKMSSIIPEPLREDAAEVAYGHPVPYSARCFIYNADAEVLIKFLRWGTFRRFEQTAGR